MGNPAQGFQKKVTGESAKKSGRPSLPLQNIIAQTHFGQQRDLLFSFLPDT